MHSGGSTPGSSATARPGRIRSCGEPLGGSRTEGPLLERTSAAHGDGGRLGDLLPDPRKIGERLGDDDPVVAAEALEALVAGMQAADGVDVGGGEQRARPAVGRVPDGPQGGAVADAERRLDRVGDPVGARDRFDDVRGPLQRLDRAVLEPERQRQVEDDLGVGRPLQLPVLRQSADVVAEGVVASVETSCGAPPSKASGSTRPDARTSSKPASSRRARRRSLSEKPHGPPR
jgi:hypothetical protein